MPTTYTDQFFLIDPGNPPAAGTALSKQFLDLIDQNDNGTITGAQPGPDDSLDGSDITAVWPGDTITVTMNGATTTITGTTFYLADGRSLFTPTDGTNLDNAVFQSSTFVTGTGPLPVGNLGPPCFAAGTMIETDSGECAVEDLQIGDLVLTMDGGLQPVLWIGASTVAGTGDHAPIHFAPGAIGNSRALRVSPQHRILLSGWETEVVCGQAEVLAAAKHLVNGTTIAPRPQARITYYHLLLPCHHLIWSDGCWTESFFPGDAILSGNRALQIDMSRHAGPQLRQMQTARPTIGKHAAMVLLAPQPLAA